MPVTDPIADFLTRIRNAQKAKLHKVEIPSSNMKEKLVKILKQEGFIKSFSLVPNKTVGQTIHIELKYNQKGVPLIREIKRLSKPGLRRYATAEKLASMSDVISMIIVSTSSGVMTDRDARNAKIGGEMICRIS